MNNEFIPYLSVDCVLFGFDEKQLKVLVVSREKVEGENPEMHSGVFKLPGRLIFESEFLQDAAEKLIQDLGGDAQIVMQQFKVFDDPNRIQSPNDLLWLQTFTQMPINRVVTIAYFALVKITKDLTEVFEQHNARWIPMQEINGLAFDHDKIVEEAYKHLKKEIAETPIEFSLLPEYFTLNNLQSLYEKLLGLQFDNRNFRKKILKLPYLVETDKTEEKVTHRPAKLYRFDEQAYVQNKREMGLYFV